MKIDLTTFNQMLPAQLQQTAETLGYIRARQGTALTRGSVEPSALQLDHFTQTVESLAGSDLYVEIREHALSKTAPQGQTPTKEILDEILPKYYPSTNLLPIHQAPTWVRTTGDRIFRSYLAPARSMLLASGLQSSWREVFLMLTAERKKKSNTGYHRFTSDKCEDRDVLSSAIRAASFLHTNTSTDVFLQPPIAWWRHQAKKYRGIFGDSLVSLAYQRKLFAKSCILGSKLVPQIAYRAPSEIWSQYARWVRSRNGHSIVSVATDVTAYDANFRQQVAKAGWEAAYGDLMLPEEQVVFDVAWERVYTSPLVDYDGSVILPTTHQTFSGQFLTNPPESLSTLRAVSWAQAICSKQSSRGFHADDYFVLVMGDDVIVFLDANYVDPQGFNEVLRTVFQRYFGLPVNRSKCRVSDEYGEFCKRVYPIDPRLVARHQNSIRVVQHALRNIKYPEDGAHNGNGGLDEIPFWCQRLDDCIDDPQYMAVVKALASDIRNSPSFDPDLVRQVICAGIGKTTWQEKLFGAPAWRASNSPTARRLLYFLNLTLLRLH